MSVDGGDLPMREAPFGTPSRTVLHVVDNFFPVVGGLERSVAALARRWLELGVRPVVLTGARPGRPARETVAGVQVVRVRPTLAGVPGAHVDTARTFFPPAFDPRATAAARATVDEFVPDIVHGHGWMFAAASAAFVGLPTVSGWHDFSSVCAKKTMVDAYGAACSGPSLGKCIPCAAKQYGTVRGAALTVALRLPRRTSSAEVAVSSAVARHMPAGTTVVPTFVADQLLADAASAPRPDFAPGSGSYMVYAGQLTGHKGVADALELHRTLLEEGRDIDLLILGLPTAGYDLPSRLGAFDARRVHIVENASHMEVLGAFRHAAFGVAPSRQEALGQVAIEMLAAACPAIVSSGTGLAEVVVDGVSGLTAAAGDPAAWHAAAVAILDDADLAARLSACGPQRAGKFCLSHVLPELLAVYDRVLGEPFLPA